jgi:predicted ATP-grasp superfamily ATP-dependent carboligase
VHADRITQDGFDGSMAHALGPERRVSSLSTDLDWRERAPMDDARRLAKLRHPSAHAMRGDHRSRLTFSLDPNLPVLLFRIGSYPLHHGTVGAIRSLGRAGVPVHAVTEDRFTPAALSRYLTSRVSLPSHGGESEADLLAGLVGLGKRLDARTMIVCTDDEAAVLVGEGRDALAEYFVLPAVPHHLPRRLASKRGLYDLCQQYGITTPITAFPTSMEELEAVLDELAFPVVVKNTDPWIRLTRPAVGGSTIISDAAELRGVAKEWRQPFCGLVQQYLPDETSEDWIVHGYWGPDASSQVAFSGRKIRSWPPRFGATAYARVEANRELLDLAGSLCDEIGYRGIFDLDWRLDRRSGQYHLLDFNPRLGAQFRLFEDDAGVDVVRAMHLDLSGRAIPRGHQLDGERFIVENLNLAARRAYRRSSEPPLRRPNGVEPVAARQGPRLAWLAFDDVVPILSFGVRQVWMSAAKRLRLAAGLVRRPESSGVRRGRSS